MSIDLEALKRISEGDPNDRVTVNRGWLQEVYRQLVTREALGRTSELVNKIGDVFAGPRRGL